MNVDWTLIDSIGEQLGVAYRARQKWRIRKVIPHKYRIEMLHRSGGRITLKTFEHIDRARASGGKRAAKAKISK